MAKITRRGALLGGLAGGLGISGCSTTVKQLGAFETPMAAAKGAFVHGVASGDPKVDGVVIWTRVSPEDGAEAVPVSWQIAEDAALSRIVKSGALTTTAARDFTVKVEVEGLAPGTRYFYRFMSGDAHSPLGRTKTLPVGRVEELRFAAMSCSNYPFGYFNAYDHIGRRDDLDAIIHLGDYIYEYGPDGYGAEVGKTLGREHSPAREIVSLADYRERHAQYKSDPASQRMHAAHPLIAIWDDHETTNNSFDGGAQNHNPDKGEGDWEERKAAALQAYFEWMPMREPQSGRSRDALYKDYQFGDLLTLNAIETRLTARTRQMEYSDIVPMLKTPEDIARFRREMLNDPARLLLGKVQLDYLQSSFERSVKGKTLWRAVANQVVMAEIIAPDLTPYADAPFVAEIEKEWPQVRAFIAFSAFGLPLNLDAWDGYPAARERFYTVAQNAGVRDLIVLTGDTHEYWANDLFRADGTKMGVELGTTAITSPGGSSYLGEAAGDYSLLMRRDNKMVRYHDPDAKGYIELTIGRERSQTRFVSVDNILRPQYEAFVSASFDLVKKGGSVEFANARGLGFKERVLF
jgi:alkaline phosphatase D